MSDYGDSGFDSFLSRSIDDLQQVNLDSQGPYSTATAYDRSQLSGSMGDKFNMGGINMSAKDSQIALNDGSLVINNTDNNFSINATGSRVNYKDSTGNTAAMEGLLPDNSVGFRLQTTQGKGLAQLSRDINGHASLKVAKEGYDASNASNDQLVFNSDQNIFKIVDSGTATIPGFTIGISDTSGTSSVDVMHNLGFPPAFLAYATDQAGNLSQLPIWYGEVYTFLFAGTVAINTPDGRIYGVSKSDRVTFYSTLTNGDVGILDPSFQTMPAKDIKYYLLQETAAP